MKEEMSKLIIRSWGMIPEIYSDISEGKPAIEILVNPEQIPDGLRFIDAPVRYASRDKYGNVFVRSQPDYYWTLCPEKLVAHIPESAFAAQKEQEKPISPFFGAAD